MHIIILYNTRIITCSRSLLLISPASNFLLICYRDTYICNGHVWLTSPVTKTNTTWTHMHVHAQCMHEHKHAHAQTRMHICIYTHAHTQSCCAVLIGITSRSVVHTIVYRTAQEYRACTNNMSIFTRKKMYKFQPICSSMNSSLN